jgi:ERCC4-type nuclease
VTRPLESAWGICRLIAENKLHSLLQYPIVTVEDDELERLARDWSDCRQQLKSAQKSTRFPQTKAALLASPSRMRIKPSEDVHTTVHLFQQLERQQQQQQQQQQQHQQQVVSSLTRLAEVRS